MIDFLKGKRFNFLLLCFLLTFFAQHLKASDIYGDDQVGRRQSFKHPKFGDIFGISIFSISDFVKDSNTRQNEWDGAKYYRDVVLAEEEINYNKSYLQMDKLWRENHPDIACQYDTLMAKEAPSIPMVIHSIWLTNMDKPVELTDQFLGYYKQSCRVHLSNAGWQHYLWVQDKTKLSKTVRELEAVGVQIKEVYRDLPDEKDFCGVKPFFDHEVSLSKFGRAADILRCVILNKFGGIYRDIDFLMTRPLTGLALAYDFFVGIENAYSYPCNALMGARTGHPVMAKALEIMNRNFDPKIAPKYIAGSFNTGGDFYHTLCLTGPISLSVALKKTLLEQGPTAYGVPIKIQSDGHRDRNIIFPPEVFFGHAQGKDNCSFGFHIFAGTWLKPEFGSKG